MKQKTVFAVFILISLSCFGMKKYTIPKDDFLKQLSAGSIPPNRVYFYQENGSKVWLLYNKNSILTISLKNGKKKDVILHTVKVNNGILEATEYNVWWSTKKVYTVNIDDVHSFYIERKTQETVMNFVDMDSSRSLARSKNDSLKNIYANTEELIIQWVAKVNTKKDTFYIRENACYHMDFKDKRQTEFGVVQKISKDSIYISNLYNQEWATINNATYKVLRYAIQDIAQLHLLRAGGYAYKTVESEDYDMIITKAGRNSLSIPCWYAASLSTGELEFYHAWLTARGFVGIREENGKMYWYEGL